MIKPQVQSEFYLNLTANDELVRFTMYDSGTPGPSLQWSADGNLKYRDRTTTWQNIEPYSANTWYHIRIDFNCTSDTFDLYINGVSKGTDLEFMYTVSALNQFRLMSGSNNDGYYFYLDAIGYSWDDNYNIGDNKEEGLLLSFNNGITLDWTGYSLDGQANKTILGNKTIPMPDEGLHTIQVFGNDSLGTMYQSDVRYFTFYKINLITPENKTYTAPMSGYYPATFGFENDADGVVPLGWSDLSGTGCCARVNASVGGHKKVVNLTDESDTKGNLFLRSITPRTNGTVEFYIRAVNATNTASFRIRNDAGTQDLFLLKIEDDKFQYSDGTWHDVGLGALNNTWYHIHIDLECSSTGYQGLAQYRWRLEIEGVEYGIYGFISDEDVFDMYYFSSKLAVSGITYYIDAFGESWDPNYNIGDNKREGLLLSFNNGTTLDWTGYSLDGQANRTILGNATIPMPDEGLHKIQVFSNDSLGTMYKSVLRYFTIDVNPDTGPGGGIIHGDDDDDDDDDVDILVPILIGVGIASAIAVAGIAIFLMRKRKLKRT